jgi:hypothetical protein
MRGNDESESKAIFGASEPSLESDEGRGFGLFSCFEQTCALSVGVVEGGIESNPKTKSSI